VSQIGCLCQKLKLTHVVSIMVTSIFLDLGRIIDMIAPLRREEAIETEATHEKVLDDVFRELFKARTFNLFWQVLNCVSLILLVL